MNTVQIYKDRGKRQPWRYRVIAGNGEIVAASEGYSTRWSARRAAKKLFPGLKIVKAKA